MTVHGKLEFEMPASAEVVFDAFHYHRWRSRWDSLVKTTDVQGGAPVPTSAPSPSTPAAGGCGRWRCGQCSSPSTGHAWPPRP